MNFEEENPNSFLNIAIEQLQWKLNLLKEGTLPNKEQYRKKIIKNFLEEFKEDERINLRTIEEVEQELRELEERKKVAKEAKGEER